MNYIQQAKDFLNKTKTTCEIKLAEVQKTPIWCKDGNHGLNYTVTLKNPHHEYTFSFWDNINNKEIIKSIDDIVRYSQNDKEYYVAEKILKQNNVPKSSFIKEKREELKAKYTPTEYDVLACLSPLYEDNFEDFCSSFGYDTDSITAKKTYEAVIEQDINLRKLWTREELEALAEIQ